MLPPRCAPLATRELCTPIGSPPSVLSGRPSRGFRPPPREREAPPPATAVPLGAECRLAVRGRPRRGGPQPRPAPPPLVSLRRGVGAPSVGGPCWPPAGRPAGAPRLPPSSPHARACRRAPPPPTAGRDATPPLPPTRGRVRWGCRLGAGAAGDRRCHPPTCAPVRPPAAAPTDVCIAYQSGAPTPPVPPPPASHLPHLSASPPLSTATTRRPLFHSPPPPPPCPAP